MDANRRPSTTGPPVPVATRAQYRWSGAVDTTASTTRASRSRRTTSSAGSPPASAAAVASTTTSGVAVSRGSCPTASESAWEVRRSPPDSSSLSAPTASAGPSRSGAWTAGGLPSATTAIRTEVGSWKSRSVAPLTAAGSPAAPAVDPSTTSPTASRSDSIGVAVLGTGMSPADTAKSVGRNGTAGTTDATSDAGKSGERGAIPVRISRAAADAVVAGATTHVTTTASSSAAGPDRRSRRRREDDDIVPVAADRPVEAAAARNQAQRRRQVRRVHLVGRKPALGDLLEGRDPEADRAAVRAVDLDRRPRPQVGEPE